MCPELVLRQLDEQIIPIAARETTGVLLGARVIIPAPEGPFHTVSLPISVMSVSDIHRGNQRNMSSVIFFYSHSTVAV